MTFDLFYFLFSDVSRPWNFTVKVSMTFPSILRPYTTLTCWLLCKLLRKNLLPTGISSCRSLASRKVNMTVEKVKKKKLNLDYQDGQGIVSCGNIKPIFTIFERHVSIYFDKLNNFFLKPFWLLVDSKCLIVRAIGWQSESLITSISWGEGRGGKRKWGILLWENFS